MSRKRKTLEQRAHAAAVRIFGSKYALGYYSLARAYMAGYRACQRDMRRKEGEK